MLLFLRLCMHIIYFAYPKEKKRVCYVCNCIAVFVYMKDVCAHVSVSAAVCNFSFVCVFVCNIHSSLASKWYATT